MLRRTDPAPRPTALSVQLGKYDPGVSGGSSRVAKSLYEKGYKY